MLKRIKMKVILCGMLLVSALAIPACTMTPKAQPLTGEDVHERHAEGMDSQVGDT